MSPSFPSMSGLPLKSVFFRFPPLYGSLVIFFVLVFLPLNFPISYPFVGFGRHCVVADCRWHTTVNAAQMDNALRMRTRRHQRLISPNTRKGVTVREGVIKKEYLCKFITTV